MHFNTRCSNAAFGLQVNLAEEGGKGYFCWRSILGQEQPFKRITVHRAYLYPGRRSPQDRRAKGWTGPVSCFSTQVVAGTLPNAILNACLKGPGDFQTLHRGCFGDAHESQIKLSKQCVCAEVC